MANSFAGVLGAFRGQKKSAAMAQEMDDLEKRVFEYKNLDRYLQRKERAAWLAKSDSLLKTIEGLKPRLLLLNRKNGVSYRSLRSRGNAIKAFLEEFDSQYVRAEVKRRKSFFDRTQLDQDQRAAVIKDASHHLVLAAAGSGKTRTLTARIALLVERGVPQEQILALAYTRAAAAEMETRLRAQYGITAHVSTLHSFSRQLAKQSPDFRSGVAGERKQRELIRHAAEGLAAKDRDFAVRLLEFAVEYKRSEEKEEDEFPSAEQYYNYLRHQKYTTLSLVPVRSIAEREIGNFLFLHGVKFEYESQAKWSDRDPAYRDYQPDFFLLAYNLWIEHWASDRDGKVPDWFSSGNGVDASKRYREGMEWKRGQFKKNNQKLLETFHYQWAEGTLTHELRRQLELNGVKLTEMPLAEIIRRVGEEMRRYPLYDTIFSFVSKGKTNGFEPSDISARLSERSHKWTNRQRRFGSLAVPIWKEYERLLVEGNMLDFNDMVNLALPVSLKYGPELSHHFQHVLVDEFQDITDPQLKLIQSISSLPGNGNTLFCVGDHRQNIFSFAGADVHNILEFEERFPYSERTPLSTNYRCPSNIVRASNELMVDGGFKQSTVAPASRETRPIRLIEKKDDSRYEEWELESAKELLSQVLAEKGKNEEILVLARYNFRLQDLRLEFPDHVDRLLRFASIHSAKGKEADYVLLLGCIGGKFGFPSTIFDESLVHIVDKHLQDTKERLEEERRLFYVALTRCKKQLYIFTSKTDRSPFLSEIKEIGRPVEGYCIRSGHRIPFNAKEPLCASCRQTWNRYRNRDYGEKFCHSCGDPSRTSFAKPLCVACLGRRDPRDVQTSQDRGQVAVKDKAYSVEAVRAKYPKAYAKWDQLEDQALTTEFRENLDIKSIAERHGRQRSAIRSRLKRLGLVPT